MPKGQILGNLAQGLYLNTWPGSKRFGLCSSTSKLQQWSNNCTLLTNRVRLNLGVFDHRIHPVAATVSSLAALVLGVVTGLAVRHWPNPILLAAVSVADPIGTLWLNAIQMIILPLAVSRLIVAIVGTETSSRVGKLGGLSLLFSVLSLTVLTVFAIVFSSAVIKRFPAEETARAALRSAAQMGRQVVEINTGPGLSFGEWMVSLVPTNLIRAASENQYLSVIIAAVMLALAMRGIASVHRRLLQSLFQAVAELTTALADYLFRVFPLAVFALIATASSKTGLGLVNGMVYYVVTFCGIMFLTFLLLYPMTSVVSGTSPRKFAAGAWPAQLVALTTRSSTAALPAMLESSRKRLGLPPEAAGFVLPMAGFLFMPSRVVGRTLELILLAHLYGVQLRVPALITFVGMMLLSSFARPGLPNGGAVANSSSLVFFVAAGVPVQGAILVSTFEVVPDIFKTLGNVTASMSIAVMTARFAGFSSADETLHVGASATGGERAVAAAAGAAPVIS